MNKRVLFRVCLHFFFLPCLVFAQNIQHAYPKIGCRIENARTDMSNGYARPNCYWDRVRSPYGWYRNWRGAQIYASSTLLPFKGITYGAHNLHDANYRTAWVEGVPGYGIGQTITYALHPMTPSISIINIVNGYVKSDKSWNDNARVKTIKVYVNYIPHAILHLSDVRNEQSFSIMPISNKRMNGGRNYQSGNITITFEILDIYPGNKFQDTAISEIYFSG